VTHKPATLLAVGLQALTWLLTGIYLFGILHHGPDFEPWVDGFLGEIVEALPAAICWIAVPAAGPRRREVIALAGALTAFAVGDLVFIVDMSRGGEAPFPSLADVGFLTFYPLALLAVVFAVRRELNSVGGAVWLDSLLGGLGASAVLAVLLETVVTQASGHSLAGGLALVYPIFDLLLVSAVIGVVAVQGRQIQLYWFTLLSGLLVFAGVDVLAAVSLASDSYELGGYLDVLWPIGMMLMSLWVLPRPKAVLRTDRSAALVVPGIATTLGLAVLVASGRIHVSTLAVGLATLTMIAAAGRTQLAFRQVGRLADLRRQATTDELTGLPNRRAFYARADAHLATPEPQLALLLLDLDRFKEVNDSLGHLVGDQLLIQIGLRLSEQLRDGDLLARLGGDEFAILLTGTTREQAIAIATQLRTAVAIPHTLEGIALRTEVSVGLSFAPDHGNELSVLLRRADIAMYKAKRARDGYRVYSDVDDAAGAGKLRAQQELHTALAEDQMTLHYQPKVDLATNTVRDVEALVRWNHPTRGLLYPGSFLELVEEAGLMRALTQCVLDQALDQAAIWRTEGRPLTVAVNLSPSSLVDDELPAHIGAMLAVRGLPASALQLEITEEFLMADRDRTRTILTELRDQGIQIAVDDFGTGYSSLAYLRELPIDELKLDRSFVFPMADDARAAALVFSTIGLAHSLGLRMVAEGVENETALRELTRHGCDQAQGYHITRALPAAELDHWLDARQLAGLATLL
jgi:diguanylate cyclase (GGDEF)-like protein